MSGMSSLTDAQIQERIEAHPAGATSPLSSLTDEQIQQRMQAHPEAGAWDSVKGAASSAWDSVKKAAPAVWDDAKDLGTYGAHALLGAGDAFSGGLALPAGAAAAAVAKSALGLGEHDPSMQGIKDDTLRSMNWQKDWEGQNPLASGALKIVGAANPDSVPAHIFGGVGQLLGAGASKAAPYVPSILKSGPPAAVGRMGMGAAEGYLGANVAERVSNGAQKAAGADPSDLGDPNKQDVATGIGALLHLPVGGYSRNIRGALGSAGGLGPESVAQSFEKNPAAADRAYNQLYGPSETGTPTANEGPLAYRNETKAKIQDASSVLQEQNQALRAAKDAHMSGLNGSVVWKRSDLADTGVPEVDASLHRILGLEPPASKSLQVPVEEVPTNKLGMPGPESIPTSQGQSGTGAVVNDGGTRLDPYGKAAKDAPWVQDDSSPFPERQGYPRQNYRPNRTSPQAREALEGKLFQDGPPDTSNKPFELTPQESGDKRFGEGQTSTPTSQVQDSLFEPGHRPPPYSETQTVKVPGEESPNVRLSWTQLEDLRQLAGHHTNFTSSSMPDGGIGAAGKAKDLGTRAKATLDASVPPVPVPKGIPGTKPALTTDNVINGRLGTPDTRPPSGDAQMLPDGFMHLTDLNDRISKNMTLSELLGKRSKIQASKAGMSGAADIKAMGQQADLQTANENTTDPEIDKMTGGGLYDHNLASQAAKGINKSHHSPIPSTARALLKLPSWLEDPYNRGRAEAGATALFRK